MVYNYEPKQSDFDHHISHMKKPSLTGKQVYPDVINRNVCTESFGIVGSFSDSSDAKSLFSSGCSDYLK